MRSGLNRRDVLKAIGTPAVAASLPLRFVEAEPTFSRMPAEGKDTPKICLGFWGPVDEPGLRRVKQIGVDYVLTGGPKIPWSEGDVRARIEQFKAGGLTLCNMMISGFDDVIWGRPGADAQIADVIASIRAAGKAGLPVVEYNFYAHRLTEGYKEETGRAGAGSRRMTTSCRRPCPPRTAWGRTRAPSSSSARGAS
jgi:mannonate dehydratase